MTFANEQQSDGRGSDQVPGSMSLRGTRTPARDARNRRSTPPYIMAGALTRRAMQSRRRVALISRAGSPGRILGALSPHCTVLPQLLTSATSYSYANRRTYSNRTPALLHPGIPQQCFGYYVGDTQSPCHRISLRRRLTTFSLAAAPGGTSSCHRLRSESERPSHCKEPFRGPLSNQCAGCSSCRCRRRR